jgi:Nif-specific regulatory protein
MPKNAASCASPENSLAALRHILHELSPGAPLEESLGGLLKALSKQMGYLRVFLAILDPEAENLRLSLSHSPTRFVPATYTPGKGVVGQVYETGKPCIIPKLSENSEFLNKAFGRSQEELESLAFICVPVVSQRLGVAEVLGTLSADLPVQGGESLEQHREFLEVVADLIANQVAQLQEEMALHKHLLAQGMVPPGLDSPPPKNFVAASKSMRMVLRQARQVAPSRATVLLRGESGTGKELLAEAIHQGSPRHDKPLIKLNCAALPSELVESELFGHQKGAFTGAVQTKRGLFEVAHNGTLFLDEIGELSLDAQAKVLRAIQEKEIQRVGGEQTLSVDVRLICATHQPLEELLTQGRFREDLFYRINVFPVFIPALRERREDILPLCEHFLQDFAREYGKSIKRISTPAIELLTMYHWPGNVRELRNCVERAVLICEEEVIRTYHLPPTLQTADSSATGINLSFGEAVAKFEQELLVDSLKKTRGNMLQSARDLRVSYRIINYKVKKYNIDVKRFSAAKPKRKKAPQA